ncbi:adaptor complex sigma subunit [Gregarina niphandrodes]|uniref:AP complex subunit sigma n=1 Tax=Gregarina niphandrodes TaxID=110365 RepID=A0A023B0M3_GRENI|nr:adaptor complex sigma subunit [Gregarina niphandrodes]EZG45465.1 adaptor complex sigma subunit [Gregarina niphandrodes]|eukprot:XP_011132483.1 adaptor complex sigma subunit [Gregarina niphandrodes]
MIRFVLLVNKLGQTRLSHYYDQDIPECEDPRTKVAFESELVRVCLSRTDEECNFILLDNNLRVIYRRYASLYFIFGVDQNEVNELSILEFIHCLVETFDRYFENVCELDIMFNLEKAHYILDEMISGGNICDASKSAVLKGVDVNI